MIYLDNAATTPCAEEVVEAMLPYFRHEYANASSVDHALGTKARDAVELARQRVAHLVGAQPEDVIFTSGSTEANNLALSVDLPVSTTPIEHPSVLDGLKARNRDVDSLLRVDSDGLLVLDSLLEATDRRKCLVSIIATNNETGVEQDIDALAPAIAKSGSLLHVDATQSIGTRPLDLRTNGISACSISAHKIYGPKGVGALIVTGGMRRELHPIVHGGGHERGMRSGTLNVPGIVGFGVAAEMASKRRNERRNKLQALHDHFYEVISTETNHNAEKTVQHARTSPHILSLRIVGTNGRALLRAVRDDVAFSLGSACATNKAQPSHVLTAMGREKRSVSETIRCSFSVEQTLDQVEAAARIIAEAARTLSEYSLPA